jgi:hypothetical protein
LTEKHALHDETICFIALAISHLAQIEEGRVALIATGACTAVVEALKVAEAVDTRGHIAFAISKFQHPHLVATKFKIPRLSLAHLASPTW